MNEQAEADRVFLTDSYFYVANSERLQVYTLDATYEALSKPKRDAEDRAIVDGEEDRDEANETYEERCNE